MLNHAKTKVLKRGGTTWFTDPALKARAEEFLKKGSNWDNGPVMELLAQNYIKKQFLNANTEVILDVDIKFILNNGNPMKTDKIQQIDFIVINKTTNKIDDFGSVKINKNKHTYGIDRDKITKYFYNLHDDGAALTQYVANNMPKTNEFTQVGSALMKGTNLRTGLLFEELPSVFKTRIRPESYYSIDKFKKVHTETLNTNSDELIEHTYQSLINKF